MKHSVATTSFLLFLSFMLFSCSGGGKKKTVDSPDDIIPHKKMVHVLVDYHLAEGSMKYYARYGASPKVLSQKIYSHILDKHNITREKFRRSMNFYTDNPDRMQLIYSDVLERLSSLQSKVRARRDRE